MPFKSWLPNDPIINSEEQIANAKYLGIWMFTVGNKYSLEEEDSMRGNGMFAISKMHRIIVQRLFFWMLTFI